jgi:hypothetical protein
MVPPVAAIGVACRGGGAGRTGGALPTNPLCDGGVLASWGTAATARTDERAAARGEGTGLQLAKFLAERKTFLEIQVAKQRHPTGAQLRSFLHGLCAQVQGMMAGSSDDDPFLTFLTGLGGLASIGWDYAHNQPCDSQSAPPAVKQVLDFVARAVDEATPARGFMFMCDNVTERECLQRMLLGLGRRELAQMQRIEGSTMLCLRNYKSGVVHGVFRAVGRPGLALEAQAWEGRFPAQVRVRRDECEHFRPVTLPRGDGTGLGRLQGVMSEAQAAAMQRLLERAGWQAPTPQPQPQPQPQRQQQEDNGYRS